MVATASSNDANSGYLKTLAHNYISRKAIMYNSKNVKLKGKCIVRPKAMIRGEFAPITIGRYAYIGEGCILRPGVIVTTNSSSVTTTIPATSTQNQEINTDIVKSIPIAIGSHTNIASECVIEAAWIGANVIIGENCVISKRVIIKDNCKILPRTIVPPGMVVPPFSVVAGCPGRIVGELPESVVVDVVEDSLQFFDQFVNTLANESKVVDHDVTP